MFKNKQEMKEVEELTNNIGKGTVLTGDIETYGNIRVEGKIIGNIKTKSKAVCGPSSHVKGNILAQNADIAGHITGKVEVSEVLILKPSAVIQGDIITNKLIVESGATFNGGCKMGVTIKEIRISDNTEEKSPIRKAE